MCWALVARGSGSSDHHTATLHQSPRSTAVAGPRATTHHYRPGNTQAHQYTSTSTPNTQCQPWWQVARWQGGGDNDAEGKVHSMLQVLCQCLLYLPWMAQAGQAATVPQCSPLHPRSSLPPCGSCGSQHLLVASLLLQGFSDMT